MKKYKRKGEERKTSVLEEVQTLKERTLRMGFVKFIWVSFDESNT